MLEIFLYRIRVVIKQDNRIKKTLVIGFRFNMMELNSMNANIIIVCIITPMKNL